MRGSVIASAVLGVAVLRMAGQARAELLYATTGTVITRFDSTAPGTAASVPVTGMVAGETLFDIDVRPQSTSPGVNSLYGLGSTGRAYIINPLTGFATPVGNPAVSPLSGTRFAIDFDARTDQLRVLSDTEQNVVINPNTGAIQTPSTYWPAGNVVGAAYASPFIPGPANALYTIDSVTGTLGRMTDAGANGPVTTIGSLGLGTNLNANIGLDYSVNAGTLYAIITNAANSTRLYSVNLDTGAATSLGTVGPGTAPFRSVATATIPFHYRPSQENFKGDYYQHGNPSGPTPRDGLPQDDPSYVAYRRRTQWYVSNPLIDTDFRIEQNNGVSFALEVGALIFENDGGVGNFDLLASITLNAQTNGAAGLQVLRGNHKLTGTLTLNAPLIATIWEADGSFEITGEVRNFDSNARSVTLGPSNKGRLILRGANKYTGQTTVKGGTLVLGKNARGPLLSSVGGADVSGGTVVFEYDTGASPAATIRGLLKSSYASNFAAGQLRSSGASASRGLGYIDVANNQVRLRLTLYGDATLDGAVNFDDLVRVAQNYNQPNAVWSSGDFDYDDVVDFDDLVRLAQNYNASLASGVAPDAFGGAFAADWTLAQSLVPEPILSYFLALSALSLCRRRRA